VPAEFSSTAITKFPPVYVNGVDKVNSNQVLLNGMGATPEKTCAIPDTGNQSEAVVPATFEAVVLPMYTTQSLALFHVVVVANAVPVATVADVGK
jgi:hypothetical protein